MASSPHRRSRRRPIVPRHADRRERSGPAPFRISVRHRATVALVRVAGEFDLAAVAPVERALDHAIGDQTDSVVFDLRGVSFLDLSGLEAIVRADERAHREAFAVQVVPPPGPTARLFTQTSPGRSLTLISPPRAAG